MVQMLESAENFDNAEKSAKVVVFDFYATWCGPCRVIAPMLEELEGKLKADPETTGKVAFYKVDVDQLTEFAQKMGISAMPTLIVYRDGKLGKTIVGANFPELTKTIEEYLATDAEVQPDAEVKEAAEVAEVAEVAVEAVEADAGEGAE